MHGFPVCCQSQEVFELPLTRSEVSFFSAVRLKFISKVLLSRTAVAQFPLAHRSPRLLFSVGFGQVVEDLTLDQIVKLQLFYLDVYLG